jgi:hypothetical protein
MRLGSLMDGLAAARQGQAEDRPKLFLASAHRVSPLLTRMVETMLFLSLGDEVVVAATAKGRFSRAPGRIWLGLTMFGLAARSSGQRWPRPSFSCANFQSESPLCTLMVFCGAGVAGLRAGCGFDGRAVARGATGLAKIFNCVRVDGTCGGIRWIRMLGVAWREKILGRAGAISLPGAGSVGRTSLLKSG